MPLMVYKFLKETIKKHGGPVTTNEIEDYARKTLPMCVDHIVHHLVTLERAKLVSKIWIKERKGFVWQVTKDYSTRELMEKYPTLYRDSLYYHVIVEAVGKQMDIDEAMAMLFDISGGSENRLSLKEVRRKIREKYKTGTGWRWRSQGCDSWDHTQTI